MIIFYRFSDGSQGGYKEKLPAATKQNCFLNFISAFPVSQYEYFVIADNVSDESLAFLQKHIPTDRVLRTDFKSGGHSFLYAVRAALSLSINEEAIVYFVEDDYVHTMDAGTIIKEGLIYGHYVTGYAHPDKFNEYGVGEPCQMYLSKHSYWKTTHSTTMTFATTVKILKEDWDDFVMYCHTGYPYDHAMFLHLGEKKGRRVVHSVPGCSTHAEVAWLSPLVDWENLLRGPPPGQT